MKTFTINGKEYKIKFGYNSFCDTDLMERTNDLMRLFNASNVEDDNDISFIRESNDFCDKYKGVTDGIFPAKLAMAILDAKEEERKKL